MIAIQATASLRQRIDTWLSVTDAISAKAGLPAMRLTAPETPAQAEAFCGTYCYQINPCPSAFCTPSEPAEYRCYNNCVGGSQGLCFPSCSGDFCWCECC